MKRKLLLFLLTGLFLFPFQLQAQENIPLDSWRTHFSYAGAHSIALTADRVYAASTNGLFYYDRKFNSTTTLSALDGLSDAGVSQLAYQAAHDLLLIAYRSANLDIIQEGKVYNVRTILEASLPGERHIYDILFHENTAWLATDYGISLLDLQSRELRESFFNLGPNGQEAEVYQLAIWNDSIFAASEKGLISNALVGANLSDFNSWRRYEEAELPSPGSVRTLAANQEGLFAGANGKALLQYAAGNWVQTSFLTDKSFRSLQAADDGIFISLENALYFYNTEHGSASLISSPLIQSPREALTDAQGNIWVADGANGLLSDLEGSFRAYKPQGPLADRPDALYARENALVAVFSPAVTAAELAEVSGGFSVFSQGSWQNYPAEEIPETKNLQGFSDVVYSTLTESYFLSSPTGGLLEWEPKTNNFRQFVAGMSGVSLQEGPEGSTPISALATDAAGQLWILQPLSQAPLHLFNPAEESWQVYLQNRPEAASALELLVLPNDDKWLRLKGSGGILVFNEEEGLSRLLSKTINEGGLLNSQVNALALDLEDQLWVGLQQGVNYFPDPYQVLENSQLNAAFFVYQGRRLLNAEAVTALAVDGGNRKWIGTPNGLWLFGDYGDTLYHHFTQANSPLPDNKIRELAVRQDNGELFIATEQGLVSYRSGATAAGFQHASAIKVFPNPVYPGYQGKVGISGLARDALIKVTDVSGGLVKELRAEGGTASWDLTNFRGQRPATGVYLIFSASESGEETLVGKVAIIN